MATMKSFTDLEQSKKLAEILPLESADMRYGYIAPYEFSDRMYEGGYDDVPYQKDFLKRNPNFSENEYDGSLPCWSLVALIEVMPSIEGFKPVIDLDINQIRYEGKYRDELCFNSNNLVDACVAMIEKLHELKLL